MPQVSDAEHKQRLHELIERAFDEKTDTRVVFLVYEQEKLTVQSVGVDSHELRNIMFHSNALLEGAHNHCSTLQ